MTDSDEKQRGLDATMENEASRDLSPMVQISLKEYDNHFELGYCRTLYSVQGDTLNSFYYPLEDKNFLNNRQVYTLISRLKQELLNIPNNYNDFDFEKAEYKKLFKNVLDQILKGHYYLK